jgi:ParB-like chromosome segregation protein Spo0J
MESFVSLKVAAEKKVHGDGVTKVTSFAVAPHLLEFNENNARPLNDAHVEEMALAYSNGAVFPPLEVRVEDGRMILIDGHHRTAGALLAIKRGTPARSLECRHFRGNDADQVAHMITSASGLPLTPLQLAVQYRKLIGFGWTEKEVAGRVGKTVQHVRDMILLAEANSDVHQAIKAGAISGSLAVTVVKQHGSKAGQVIQQGLAEEQARGKGKGKVTAKTLARKAASSAPTDTQVLAWLLANVQREGYRLSDGTVEWRLRLIAPADAPNKGSKLRETIVAAMKAAADNTITPTT